MSDRDLITSYFEGRIVSWTVVRRLMKAGITVGTALAFTALLPSALQTGDTSRLQAFVDEANPDEAFILRRVMDEVSYGLVRIAKGHSTTSLSYAVTKMTLRAANNQINYSGLSFNDVTWDTDVNVRGAINNLNAPNDPNANEPNANRPNNFSLVLGGDIGQVPMNLSGFVNVNVNGDPTANGVQMNLGGNIGQLPFNVNTVSNEPK